MRLADELGDQVPIFLEVLHEMYTQNYVSRSHPIGVGVRYPEPFLLGNK